MPALTCCLACFRGGQKLPARGPNPAKLALCWLIFRSWAPFFRSCLPLARLLGFFCSCWSFFLRFGPLRVRFWSVQSQFWRALTLIYRCFVARAFLPYEKTPKTTVFLGFLYTFYTSQALCSSHKTAQNRSRSPSNRASYEDGTQNASWAGF